jgi:hypothetical protein
VLYSRTLIDEIRWLPLRDRVVNCEVRVLGLADGALEPFFARVVNQLTRESKPLTLDEIASQVGATPRIIAELLDILKRTNYVSLDCDEHGDYHFSGNQDLKLLQRPSNIQIINGRFRYIPRSNQLDPNIPGTYEYKLDDFIAERIAERSSKLAVPQWKHPDENILYTIPNLKCKIEKAYVELCNSPHLSQDFPATNVRQEILQRSKLLIIRFKAIKAEVLTLELTPYYVIHSCFLYRSNAPGSHSWNIEVRYFPFGPKQETYTSYLREVAQNEAELDRLVAASTNKIPDRIRWGLEYEDI